MPKKKSVKKKHVKKKPSIRKYVMKKEIELPKTEIKIEKVLVENFVSLQKVLVNLSMKFDNLTHQISKLLDLFELSAKALAEKDFNMEKSNRDNTKVLEKIDTVLDQNKTIARGLTLMHEKVNEQPSYPPAPISEKSRFLGPPKPSFRPIQKPTIKQENEDGYHRSISSKEKELP